MRKSLFIFVFLISCSSVETVTPKVQNELLPETVTTFSPATTEAELHHSEEYEDHNNNEKPNPMSLPVFKHNLIVPDGVPDKLEVLNYNLGEEAVINFEAIDIEIEIHVHGYDLHFMVYPNQDNILKIELTIAGEFEIEDHASGYEFARLIVSP
jgi:hypothetical protein